MEDRYTEPVDWKSLIAALTIWTAHFSALWGASSALPGDPAARWIALAATVAALLGLAWLRHARRGYGPRVIPDLSAGIAAAAIGWGALPAVVG